MTSVDRAWTPMYRVFCIKSSLSASFRNSFWGVFSPDQRLTISFTLGDGTVIQEKAVALHVDTDEGVGVFAPRTAWVNIDKAHEFDNDVNVVRLTYPMGVGAEEVDARVKRWPTRPRAHFAVQGFSDVNEIRRRRFVRVDTGRPLVFGYAAGTKFVRLTGMTVNISAGGVMAVFAEPIPHDAFVAVFVDLGPRTITAVGVLIDVRRAEPDMHPVLTAMEMLGLGEDDDAWQARLEFNQISTSEQNALAAWTLRHEQQARNAALATLRARDRAKVIAEQRRKEMLKNDDANETGKA
jgi:hypothetical protein